MRPRKGLGSAGVVGVVAFLLALQCSAPVVPGAPRCPELSVDGVDRFDYPSEMKIQPPIAAKLKPGLDAALILTKLAETVDSDLNAACKAYLADLGIKAQGTKTVDVCHSLIASLSEARAKLGPEVRIDTDFVPPLCSASLDAANVCASQCDPNVAAAAGKASCEPGTLEGTCDALCSGSCEGSTPTKCAGDCIGACDARVKGVCSGVCSGRCDGRPSRGACLGVCEGMCEGAVLASCTGNCTGTCVESAPASCAGTCLGNCSSEMKGTSCTGTVSPPKMAAECKAKCDALVVAGLTCPTASVFVRVSDPLDPVAAQRFKDGAEKNLPSFLKIAVGVGENVQAVTAEVTDTVATVTKATKAALASPTAVAGFEACFEKPMADVTLAVASLDRSLDLAVSVKATLASGGPGAGAVLVPSALAVEKQAIAAAPVTVKLAPPPPPAPKSKR